MRAKHRTVLAVLIAVFAISAVAAASASATLPEISVNGKHANKEQPISFTLKGQSPTIHAEWFGELSCSSLEGSGSFTSGKAGTAKLTLTGCDNKIAGGSCESSENKIVSETVPIVLVYTSKEPKQVAIDFNHAGNTFMTFHCNSHGATVRHEILAPITVLNTVAKSFAVTMRKEGKEQIPRENFNEGLTGMEKSFPEITFTGWEEFAVTSTDTLGEIKQQGKAVEAEIEA